MTERIKVLIIEGDEIDRYAFERYIEKKSLPYNYNVVNTVKESKDIISKKFFDVIVADYMLIDGTIFDLLSIINTTPVIITTRAVNEETAVRMMREGAYDFLIKDPKRNYLKVLHATVENAIRRKRAEESLKIINSITEALNRHLELDSIYKIIIDKLSELEFVDSTFLYLLDNPDTALLKYHKNVPDEYIKNTSKLQNPNGVIWEIINQNKPINIKNLNDYENKTAYIKKTKFKSFMGIPINVHDQPIGALIVASFNENMFTTDLENLLVSIAGQLAIAVTRAQNYDEVSKKGVYETIIRNISQTVHQTLDLDEVLNNAVDALAKSIKNVDNSGIYLIEGDNAILRAQKNLSDDYIKRAGIIAKPKGYTWKTILSGTPQYCENVDKDTKIGPAGRDAGFKSYLSMPIRHNKNTIGSINVNSLIKNAFDKDELKLLENVASQIETAIINASIAEKLKKSEERYKLLYDDNPSMYFTLNYEGVILSVNKFGCEQLGYSQDELIGKNVIYIFHQEDKDTVKGQLNKCINSPGRMFTWEFRKIKKDGSVIWVKEFARAIYTKDKQIAVFVVCQDVTDNKKVEAEIQKVQRLDSLGVLAGGLAHDFNNMLTSILGNISMIKLEDINNDNIASKLDEAEKACIRAKDITNQLLTFSRGGMPVKKITDSLIQIVKDAAGFALSGSNIKYEMQIEGALPPVEIDEGQINQVINNIVINSEHAMPEGGVINISISPVNLSYDNKLNLSAGDYIKISIIDSGVGISESILPKIFDPFFTLKERGNGLGLTTAYSIIKNHKGHIEVISQLNKGTAVSVYLPASDKSFEHIAEKKGIHSGSGKILIMDDDDSVREVIGAMLKHLGYKCEYAREGKEVIDIYQKHKNNSGSFDAVILDLTIKGGMGGRDAIKILREFDPEIKAIVSSGYNNDTIMSEYREYGFIDVIKKPYNIEQLSRVLRSVLHNHYS